jgi:hypothetical protein
VDRQYEVETLRLSLAGTKGALSPAVTYALVCELKETLERVQELECYIEQHEGRGPMVPVLLPTVLRDEIATEARQRCVSMAQILRERAGRPARNGP